MKTGYLVSVCAERKTRKHYVDKFVKVKCAARSDARLSARGNCSAFR